MRRTGFTVVELLCVIAIVAALAAVAVPRLIELNEDAYRASVAQHAASFATAVQFVHLDYLVHGRSGPADNLMGFGDGTVDTNAAGYPTDSANAHTIPNNPTGAMRCRNVYLAILQSPAPICGGPVACTGDHDFQATTAGGQVCRFNYIRDSGQARYFTYNARTGLVATVNP